MILTIAIIKGGTGKSTTAAALAQAGAYAGKKILAIDLDPQGNLTAFLDGDPTGRGSYDLLHGRAPDNVIQRTRQGVYLAAAGPDLATEQSRPGSAKRLAQAIEPLKGLYDYIIIDTPPNMGELTLNALQTSEGLIIPAKTESGSLQGLYTITDIAGEIRRSNPGLNLIRTVITDLETRSGHDRFMLQTIRDKAQEAGAPVLAEIRHAAAIRGAQLMRQSIFAYAPRSRPAKEYRQLFELINNMAN